MSMEDEIKPHPLKYKLEDYYYAIDDIGELAKIWENRPHLLVFDLIGVIMQYQKQEEAQKELLNSLEKLSKVYNDSKRSA